MHITKNINIHIIKRTATNEHKIQFLPGKKTVKDTEKRFTEQETRMQRRSTPLKNTVMKVRTMELHILSFREAKIRS